MTDHEELQRTPSRRMLLGGGAALGGLAIGGIVGAPAANAASYVRPVKNPTAHPITAQWRQPGNWAAGYHTGVDIGCPIGTPVYATIGGDVRTGRANWGSAYGTMILINDNVDGSDWGYCHLSRRVVSDGQRVATNQAHRLLGQHRQHDRSAPAPRAPPALRRLRLGQEPQPVALTQV